MSGQERGASIVASLQQMTLLAHMVGFREPRRHFAVYLLNGLKSERVEMISGRESFDAAKTRIFQAPRQNNVPVDPVSPNDERGKAHPDLESDSRFLGQDSDRSAFLRDGQQLVEDCSDGLWLAGKMRGKGGLWSAGVGLIAIGEEATAT